MKEFPFLIGKVLTGGQYDKRDEAGKFPFLIGKVLTESPTLHFKKGGELCFHSL